MRRTFHGLFSAVLSVLLGALHSLAAVHPHDTVPDCILNPNLEIHLFAQEPDIVDPVGLTFDEDGRIFVVEMRDYPIGIGEQHKPGGTIRLLEDLDGDGKIDRSTLFAEGLSFPTSIVPWKGGVIVTVPPQIIYLKDTDGDGRADYREVLFDGFVLGVTDSNVNGLTWGLDSRIHGCNGGNGGMIGIPGQKGPRISIQNLDFSFDPQARDFTPTFQTGGGFGLIFDTWGHSFVTYNINHIQERIIPVRYSQRFSGLPPLETTVSISDHEEMSRIYPISVAETRVNHPEQAGHFSSAGGMGLIPAFYPGDLGGSILVCDVVGNLVHRDVLKPSGPIFVAGRSPTEERSEFFAARDNAFRPVGVVTGPDGALYLIDMQRDVIEHPDYIPEKIKAKINLRAGEDRGRIYRITPKTGLPPFRPHLSSASSSELANLLASTNSWLQGTAQRLLVERHATNVNLVLNEMAKKERFGPGRVRALWTLHALGGINESVLLTALSDSEPGVRENAIQVAEVAAGHNARLQGRILALLKDPEPRVRFQAILTAGEFLNQSDEDVLVKALSRDIGSRWSRLAILSALKSNVSWVFGVLQNSVSKAPSPDDLDALQELADLAGVRQREIGLVLLSLKRAKEPILIASVDGLISGSARAEKNRISDPEIARRLEDLVPLNPSARILASLWKLEAILGCPPSRNQHTIIEAAMKLSRDSMISIEERKQQIELLQFEDSVPVRETLFALLSSYEPSPIQGGALAVLQKINSPEVAAHLINGWHDLAPTLRVPVINLLLQRIGFHGALMDAIESGRITLGELNLDLEQRRILLRESTPEIKKRAAKLIGDEEYSNRKTVVTEWLQKIPAEGNSAQGRVVFEANCAKCHAVGKVGRHVGPDLSDVSHRSLEDLLSNILDPNMAINPSYIAYNAETDSGELVTGILQAESAQAVTLLQAEEKKVVLPRAKIKKLSASGLSLMPEGFENVLTPKSLRDLLAFLIERQ